MDLYEKVNQNEINKILDFKINHLKTKFKAFILF